MSTIYTCIQNKSTEAYRSNHTLPSFDAKFEIERHQNLSDKKCIESTAFVVPLFFSVHFLYNQCLYEINYTDLDFLYVLHLSFFFLFIFGMLYMASVPSVTWLSSEESED